VFNTTLQEVFSARTRIERGFDSQAIRRMKEEAERDLSASGPHLAAQATRAGLVDECHLFVAPVVVGAGKRALPADLRRELGCWRYGVSRAASPRPSGRAAMPRFGRFAALRPLARAIH
jgi:hypothetical protein